MQYRSLGQTGLTVSVIGFGASPLGNEFGNLDAKVGVRAVHAAIERGVNFFDTSPYYGRTLSETRLGEALRGKRHRVILATKGGRYDVTSFDFSAKRLRHSVEESLTRLRTDVIDLYQLHDIEFVPVEGIITEALPALDRLRDEGKIRFIGITGYPLPLLQNVAEHRPVDTILSYCHYNLINTTLVEALVPFAIKNGVGVINASPLHMGVLTEQGAQSWHPAPQQVHELGRKAALVVRDKGGNVARLALQFVLQNPSISTSLVGMRTEREVIQNVSLVGSEPDEALLTAVETIIAPVKDINWQVGLPENHEPGTVTPR